MFHYCRTDMIDGWQRCDWFGRAEAINFAFDGDGPQLPAKEL